MDHQLFGVSPIEVERQIVSENYFTAHDGATGGAARRTRVMGAVQPGDEVPPKFALHKVMICALTLRNDCVVIGTAQVTLLDQFDERLARQVARTNAVNEIPRLIRYGLLTKLLEQREEAARC